MPAAAKTASNAAVNLRISVPHQRPEPIGPLAEVHQQVPGLLGYPLLRRMRGDTEQVDPADGYLNDEQHIQPPQQHGVHREEVHRQRTLGLHT